MLPQPQGSSVQPSTSAQRSWLGFKQTASQLDSNQLSPVPDHSHFPFPARTYSGGDVAGAGVLPVVRQPQLFPNTRPKENEMYKGPKSYAAEIEDTRR